MICFEEELWILTSRFLFSFALYMWFFSEEFSQNVAYRGHAFMKSTKNNEGEGAGGTTFWPMLLMVAHDFWGRGFFSLLWTLTRTISKSLSFRGM